MKEKLPVKLPKKNGNEHPKKGKIFELKFNLNLKNIFIGLFIAFLVLSMLGNLSGQTPLLPEKPLSTLVTDIKADKVKQIEVVENKILAEYKDGQKVQSHKEGQDSLFKVLEASGVDPKSVEIKIKDLSMGQIWLGILSNVLPLALTVLFFLFIFRQARGAQDSIFSFGQSKARIFSKDLPKITFADVAGVDEAKKELEEVVDFLRNPAKYKALGARTPKGVILVGPSGTGKCVTGDTIIWTNKGLMEIADVPKYYYVDDRTSQTFGTKIDSIALNGSVHGSQRSASHWYCLGEQQTLRLELAQGFSLEGTPEHPVVIMNNEGQLVFCKLADLKEGDVVAIQFGQNRFGNTQTVDVETAYLLGLLTGDGNMSVSSRVGLTSNDPEIVQFFTNYMHQRFSHAAIYKKSKYDYIVTSWELKRYLYLCGMSYLLSFDKQIPPAILQAKKEVVVAFLQGLFDTDASIGASRAEFEYTTVSLKLARQVHALLLNLGVVPSFNVKGKRIHGYHRPVYRITILGTQLPIFACTIGFRLSRKQKLLAGWAKRSGRGVNTNVDLFYHVGPLVDGEWRQLSKSGRSNEFWSKRIHHVRTRQRISRLLLEQFLTYCRTVGYSSPRLRYLEQLFRVNLYFSPVVAKKDSTAVVYDFTVPGTHNFIGNGFINHNTLLAKAMAGEAKTAFYSIAGSEFMEMLVGVGAARVRDLFSNAKKNAPAIIFIDEIDAIGRMRSVGIMGGHDEREQTLNQILVEMDGFEPNTTVLIVAATNRGDLLDPALLRPGRFDRRVVLDLPDMAGRKDILKIHAKGKPFVATLDWDKVAKRTVGFSGADLENMLNEAAILAARESKKEINNKDIEEAATKVKLGPEKKRLQSDLDRKMTAYHEAGHAVVSYNLPHLDIVHRISIVSRGMALGYTLSPPEKDRLHETKSRLIEEIAMTMGGRAAEQLIFHDMTSGAANDIDQATRIARYMVMEFGMSELGPINFGPHMDITEWGKQFMEQNAISQEMQGAIDREVKKLIDEGYKKAAEILKKYRKKLDVVAEALIKKETLESEEFEGLMGGSKKRI